MSPSLPFRPQDVLAVGRELRSSAADTRPLVVSGHFGLVTMLRRELVRDGEESAVREGGTAREAAAIVYVLAEEATDADLAVLREAERIDVPSIAVIVESEGSAIADPPYVLPSRVVRVPSGSGFPVDDIAGRLAKALGDRGSRLAARLPAVRDAFVDETIQRYARRNAFVGTLAGRSRAVMPVLTLDQIRLVLRIADAYGQRADRERAPEVAGVIVGGFGLRAAARGLLRLVPLAGFAVRGGVAYGGTLAIGEAAKRYFAAK